MKLAIVILYVHDLQKEKAFYSDVVGLPINKQESEQHCVAFEQDSGVKFALEDIAISKADKSTRAGSSEIGLRVDDVDGTWKSLKARRAEIITEIEDKPFGRSFEAKDPEGHFVTIVG